MYASHRDSCILAKYSSELVGRLDKWYSANGLNETVVAYRPLGKSNYHFAERVQNFVRSQPSLTVMCFDVTGFFDNLNHAHLKERIKWLLEVDELPADWYAVFRAVARYRFVNLEHLKAYPPFAQRLKARGPHPLATIKEVKTKGVLIEENKNKFGIPQGTPISASFSNLYMTLFDLELAALAAEQGALYQRYSDDILIACPPSMADAFEKLVEEKLSEHHLNLQKDKTDRVTLAGLNTLSFQYLGYQLGLSDARLRHKSLSKQWRTARRALKKTERIGNKAIKAGTAKQIYTRKLHLRFTSAGPRNFLSYVDRSSDTLNSTTMQHQAKKLRRFVRREIARMRSKPMPKP